ncbi:ABC transporter ATP-binding protein [Halobacteriales archaeon QS_1_68_20]|nr:MAG: ABC transporter ATP-binding protein [Halobacteriales archaeon QS_1_68_20]
MLAVEGIDTYYGRSHVLFDLSLEVGAGETVALIGNNGAGKTTTLRSIMGLTPPERGRILFRGEEIQGCKPNEIRRRGVSLVPEDRRIFPSLTVAENVELAAAAGSTTTDVYDRFPVLDDRRDQRAGTLSGGEQQMLAIARGLVGPPTELLLLDEPTEGLAPQIVEDVSEVVEALTDDGITILLVEQNAELALELADRAYVIETGRIVHEAGGDELLHDPEVLETHLGVR